MGITCFDLANNYGPPGGSAEETFGRILREDLGQWRDELIITTKAGYDMWPGPMANGVRANIYYRRLTSRSSGWVCRMWIFFIRTGLIPTRRWKKRWARSRMRFTAARRFSLEFQIIKPAETVQAAKILRELGTPCIIHQPRYSMLDRWVEPQLLATLEAEGIGCTVFSPLAKGILTDRYFKGIPADSRAGHDQRFLRPTDITDLVLAKTKKLNDLAQSRGQTLAQMALAWVLRHKVVTSALIGASKASQVDDCVGATRNLNFTGEELARIEQTLA